MCADLSIYLPQFLWTRRTLVSAACREIVRGTPDLPAA